MARVEKSVMVVGIDNSKLNRAKPFELRKWSRKTLSIFRYQNGGTWCRRYHKHSHQWSIT
ncbi:hypothetical protein BVC80_1181g15 [Macleaya cordata]|uniref:Uncharacterized protein n=1 Tax=Macleaya cordata TaxID=56857 RepID=A0A200PQA0_MACCD|nr:hypothetical protein BVC80_1181g15 [Macleaya cordata]